MEREKLMAMADYLIVYMTSHGQSLNLIKLQRLLYLAYAWHLVFSGGEPMSREKFRAWRYGPVNQTLQHYFTGLTGPAEPIHLSQRYFRSPLDALAKLTDEEVDDFELVADVYGGLSSRQLEDMLRGDEAWSSARDGLDGDAMSDREITDDLILRFYNRQLQ